MPCTPARTGATSPSEALLPGGCCVCVVGGVRAGARRRELAPHAPPEALLPGGRCVSCVGTVGVSDGLRGPGATPPSEALLPVAAGLSGGLAGTVAAGGCSCMGHFQCARSGSGPLQRAARSIGLWLDNPKMLCPLTSGSNLCMQERGGLVRAPRWVVLRPSAVGPLWPAGCGAPAWRQRRKETRRQMMTPQTLPHARNDRTVGTVPGNAPFGFFGDCFGGT